MMRKYQAYFAILVVVVAVTALFGFKGHNPKARRPQIGVTVHPATKRFLFHKNIVEAKQSAERLDAQARGLIEAKAMGYWERWTKTIDLKKMEDRYARDVVKHVSAMTEVMKIRRENGGKLRALHEFDFQNLLRKSDYLLSLKITSSQFKKVSPDLWSFYKLERKVTSLRPLVAAN